MVRGILQIMPQRAPGSVRTHLTGAPAGTSDTPVDPTRPGLFHVRLRASIDAALATARDQTVTLGNKMPVHLLYWTAWANEDGSVSFRPDIYDRDSVLDQALHTRAPDA